MRNAMLIAIFVVGVLLALVCAVARADEPHPIDEVLAACQGRDETPGSYPIDCRCFRVCLAEGWTSDPEDCIGLCD